MGKPFLEKLMLICKNSLSGYGVWICLLAYSTQLTKRAKLTDKNKLFHSFHSLKSACIVLNGVYINISKNTHYNMIMLVTFSNPHFN